MMNSITGLKFLRPGVLGKRSVSVRSRLAYLAFFHTTRWYGKELAPRLEKRKEGVNKDKGREERIAELKAADGLRYPRIKNDPSSKALSVARLLTKYKDVVGDECKDLVVIRGRVTGIRSVGGKLNFLKIVDNGSESQVCCNFGVIEKDGGSSLEEYKDFHRLVRRGDVISAVGLPYRPREGPISLKPSKLPTILSPSLTILPKELEDKATRIRSRHIDLLVNQNSANVLRLRSLIINTLRGSLMGDGFVEVQTPLMAASAGGALAKPFTTTSSEFPSKQLAFRIAPELWLKRLVIGGLSRVFEIGPSFRNEGIDGTHNPEFTTCEFYKAYANLEDLISMTEGYFGDIARKVQKTRNHSTDKYQSLPPLNREFMEAIQKPFQRISFIPGIEKGLGYPLPDLSSSTAQSDLLAIFKDKGIPVPKEPTVSHLLDKLCEKYIEPLCTLPTFIIYHPAIMSPLSKSFSSSDLDSHEWGSSQTQMLSARAELFVNGMEMANMYEEENSPFEQRRKFLEQVEGRDGGGDGEGMTVDESYLEALESALPPTGGWGCGVDRLVMLFTGAERISDVLAFGTLRNVVGLASRVVAGGRREAEVGVGETVIGESAVGETVVEEEVLFGEPRGGER